MIRFKIKEVIAKKEFTDNKRITIGQIAEATNIHRMTLSKMINQRGYNTGTDNLDSLCQFFDCPVEDIIEYVPTNDITESSGNQD